MSPQQQLAQHHTSTTTNTNAPDRALTTIGVIGLGYVGLPLAVLAASRGYQVVGFDIDETKVTKLMRREADFLSEEEKEGFRNAQTLSVTNVEHDLDAVNTFIVCVPTPVREDHMPDLRPLESASRLVGRHLKRGDLVVIESTVSPGVCERIALRILEEESGLEEHDFDFAHCPERINPGDGVWDVGTIPRVVGARSTPALERTAELYGSLVGAKIVRMGSIKEAEAVKMLENAFRDVNIAFVNELAIAFDRAGIDITNVIRGASTKPFGYMPFYPGCGVGGHCIPVDPYYLIRYGRENGFEHKFLVAAREVNTKMPFYAVTLLEQALRERGKRLFGSTIALLGLSYKRGIPDTRESPAIVIRDALLERGALVRTFDPYAQNTTTQRLSSALHGADAALIATDHEQIRSLTPQHFLAHDVDIVIDGRNCLRKDTFARYDITYRGIGRPSI